MSVVASLHLTAILMTQPVAASTFVMSTMRTSIPIDPFICKIRFNSCTFLSHLIHFLVCRPKGEWSFARGLISICALLPLVGNSWQSSDFDVLWMAIERYKRSILLWLPGLWLPACPCHSLGIKRCRWRAPVVTLFGAIHERL